MDKREIATKLKEMIESLDEITIEGNGQELDIDSFTMMMIITFIAEEMDVQLDMDSLDFDAFTSIDTLTDLVLAESVA